MKNGWANPVEVIAEAFLSLWGRVTLSLLVVAVAVGVTAGTAFVRRSPFV